MSEPSNFVRVNRVVVYKAIKTTRKYKKGQRVSRDYAKRYPRLVKPQEWMQIQERQVKFDPKQRRQVYGKWKITSREKMNYYEKILDLKELTTRSVSDIFARNRVYSNIWENNKGTIRITVNGFADGKRVKEVVHIGYLKSVWYNRHNGYSEFKDYLVNKVLEALRRRRLRLSNPKESMGRIARLRRKVQQAYKRLESVPAWKHDDVAQEIKSLNKLIKTQKQTAQVTRSTIRIEKLVPH